MVNLFGRKKKKEAKEAPVRRVWPLDHVVSRSKPKDDLETLLKTEEELAKRAGRRQKPKRPKKQLAKKAKARPKPMGRVLTRRDDLEALLSMEETLARKRARKPEGMEKPEQKKKGHGVLYFLKPKFRSGKKAEKPKKPEPVPVIEPVIKKGQITTQIDEMLNMVIEKKKAKLDYLSKKLKIPEKTVERWAEILQDDDLITIHYPAFGKPELRIKTKKAEGG